jgi:hypothetical protein
MRNEILRRSIVHVYTHACPYVMRKYLYIYIYIHIYIYIYLYTYTDVCRGSVQMSRKCRIFRAMLSPIEFQVTREQVL